MFASLSVLLNFHKWLFELDSGFLHICFHSSFRVGWNHDLRLRLFHLGAYTATPFKQRPAWMI